MISDIVCEQLVKRKFGTFQMLKAAGVLAGGLVLSFLLLMIGTYADPAVGMLGSMFFIVGMALTGYLVRFVIFVEYEYTFVNGELAIDRILARSNRKHLTDIRVKSFEKLGKYSEEAVKKLNPAVVWDYSIDKFDPHTMYAFFKDDKSGRNTLLLFTPNQKVLDAMKTYVSATVYREAFKAQSVKNAEE